VTTVVIYTTQAINLPSLRMRLIEPLLAFEPSIKVVLGSGWNRDGRFSIDQCAWQSADVVIVHRNFPSAETIPLIRQVAASGKRLVYETDDAFQLLPDSHPKAFHKLCAPFIDECAAMATTVVVSTDNLSTLYNSCREVLVLKNMLSTKIWGSPPDVPYVRYDAPLRVALVGGMHHLDDFLLLKSVVVDLNARLAIEWVCYGDGATKALKLMNVKSSASIPNNFDYPTHPKRLRSLGMSLALCPLVDTEFNRCISDVKYLEFGYLGVPIIASGLPGYADEIVDGVNGYVANTADDWISRMEHALHRRDELKAVGAAAQSHIIDRRLVRASDNRYEALVAHE
jgi:hypothetical protein